MCGGTGQADPGERAGERAFFFSFLLIFREISMMFLNVELFFSMFTGHLYILFNKITVSIIYSFINGCWLIFPF